MMERLERFVPPGMTAFRIKVATVTAIVLSLLFSLGFLASYNQELAELKRQMEYPVFHLFHEQDHHIFHHHIM